MNERQPRPAPSSAVPSVQASAGSPLANRARRVNPAAHSVNLAPRVRYPPRQSIPVEEHGLPVAQAPSRHHEMSVTLIGSGGLALTIAARRQGVARWILPTAGHSGPADVT